MKHIVLGITVLGILSVNGCATIQEPVVHEIPEDQTTQVTIGEVNKDVPKGLKRKIAIARFSNETRYGQSFFIDKKNDRIGKQAMDILSAKLFETGKFIMLERADLSKVQDELRLSEAPSLKNSADYLILGSITEFGRKDSSDVGIFSRVKKQEVFAKVHIRIVDVYTGQIIYSEEGNGVAFSEAGTVMGVGGKAGYNAQLNDKAIDAAISDLASNVIENMLDKPWRGYILGYEDGNLITSGGKSQNIQAGDTFDIIREGKKVNNPQTNMFITLPGVKIATVEVLQTLGDTPISEVSLAALTSGNIDSYIKGNDFSNIYIQVNKDTK